MVRSRHGSRRSPSSSWPQGAGLPGREACGHPCRCPTGPGRLRLGMPDIRASNAVRETGPRCTQRACRDTPRFDELSAGTDRRPRTVGKETSRVSREGAFERDVGPRSSFCFVVVLGPAPDVRLATQSLSMTSTSSGALWECMYLLKTFSIVPRSSTCPACGCAFLLTVSSHLRPIGSGACEPRLRRRARAHRSECAVRGPGLVLRIFCNSQEVWTSVLPGIASIYWARRDEEVPCRRRPGMSSC